MFLKIFIFVISLPLSFIMKPKTPEQAPPAVGDLSVPKANEGTPIPVVFGSVKLTSPNCAWYGDVGYSEVRTSGGK